MSCVQMEAVGAGRSAAHLLLILELIGLDLLDLLVDPERTVAETDIGHKT